MEEVVPAIIVIAICLALAVILMARENSKMIDAGRIISRTSDFVENDEEFILRPVAPEQVVEALKTFNYTGMKVKLSGSSAEQSFRFTGQSFNAKLCKVDGDDTQMRYRFSFTNWKSHNDIADDAMTMNELLTSVEKMFVSFDPNTQVKTIPMEVSTKHKLL